MILTGRGVGNVNSGAGIHSLPCLVDAGLAECHARLTLTNMIAAIATTTTTLSNIYQVLQNVSQYFHTCVAAKVYPANTPLIRR